MHATTTAQLSPLRFREIETSSLRAYVSAGARGRRRPCCRSGMGGAARLSGSAVERQLWLVFALGVSD
jgi:hypothetical protein